MILPVPLRTSETIRVSTASRLGRVAPACLSTNSNAASAACVCTGGAGNATWLCHTRSVFTPFQLSADNWKGRKTERVWQSQVAFPAPPVQTQAAEAAFELVLKQAGATLPRRDAVDTRIVSDVRNGTGRIINKENEVGGWPAYASGEPPVSSANDGIPDEWKKAHGLSLSDPDAANAVNADGYTELELYLNSLVSP